MPGDASKTPRKSWKGTGGSSSRSTGTSHAWKKGPKAEVDPKLPRSKSARIVIAAASCAAVVALIICLILMIVPPRPACLTLIGADYATNLRVPHNVFGTEGLRGLEALTQRKGRYAVFGAPPPNLTGATLTLDKAEQWDAAIQDLVKKRVSEQTMILVLSLHGVSDPTDGPYLLPNGASRPEDRLPLKKVIEDMKKLPRDKDKVLILEAAEVPADWRLGMLHNDFARQLEELEPEIAKVDRLWVLSAAGPDQRCWASEALGRTIFSHFVIDGLAGRAAGSDRRVDLGELYQHVRSNVRSWVWKTRGAIQEPVLLPRVDASKKPVSASTLLAQAGRVVLVSTGEPLSFTPPTPPNTTKLEQEWTTFQSLSAFSPPPWVYTPRQWRAYRAALVRYDELTRAGATRQAQELEARLNVLARNIRDERHLDERHPTPLTSSMGNSLVFNAVQGRPVDDPSSSKTDFSRFWVATENPNKVWQDLQAGDPSTTEGKRRPIRLRVDDFLISRAAENAAENLGKAADRIELTKGNDTQPIEAHFVRMLNAHVPVKEPGSPVWKPVEQAIRVRRLAERAAIGIGDTAELFAYSEQVQPWIKPIIEKADNQRRQAEDLLFSTDRDAWEDAGKSLENAGSLYKTAIERARRVRAASQLRDRVLADLPEYSRWLPHRLPDELNDEMTETLKKLWEGTHRLVDTLESPATPAGDGLASNADLDAIDGLVREVGEGFTTVQQRFDDQKNEIDRTRRPGDWEAADAAASVAIVNPDSDFLELRRSLWQRLSNIGKRDVEDARPDKKSSDDPTAAQLEKAPRLLWQRAAIQGQMALAVLGQRWFNDDRFLKQDHADFKGISDRLEKFQGQSDGSTSLAVAGKEVGARWERLSTEIELAYDDSGKTDPASMLSRWREADRHNRLLDGAGAAADTTHEASTRYRAWLVHHLLIWLADRTWNDHWYDEDSKTTPYYKIAGGNYLTDADRLVSESTAVKEARQRLNQPSRLDFVPTERIIVTSELSKPVSYRVADIGTVPPGTPVLTPSPGDLLELNQEAKWVPVSRAIGGQPGQAAEFFLTAPSLRKLEEKPVLTRPQISETAFHVKGLFRGQRFEADTPVAIHPLPEITVLGPEFTDSPGTIAVRAQREIVERFGAGTGAITIILDCSGSMRFDTKGVANNAKINNAKHALVEVLKTIPTKTKVSIWVYGQLREGTTRESPWTQYDHDHPEETIMRLFPAKDGPNASDSPIPWNREKHLPIVEQKLAALTPYHDTPLVKAMVKAKKDLSRKDLKDQTKGFRSLVVLTDGSDSQYPAKTRSAESTQIIKDAFTDEGIMINMILFELPTAELEEARKQFGEALSSLDPPGKLIPANIAQLIDLLRKAFQQRLVCEIWKDDDVATKPLEPLLDVTDAERDQDRWFAPGLKSAAYRLKVTTDRTYECKISVAKGDRLVINLTVPPGQDLTFERAIYSDEFPEKQPYNGVDGNGGWRLAVLEDQGQVGTNRLQLFATFEKTTTRGIDFLRVRKPVLTWFGLTSPFGQEGDYALRWRERALYPAPAWQLDVPDWPVNPGGTPSKPTVKVWYNPDQEIDKSGTVSRPADFRTILDLIEKQVLVKERESVWIESVQFEEHFVESEPGGNRKLTECLVVRLRYPPGKPYWIDPTDLPGIERPKGYEHRFYTRANRYTGLFWRVTKEQVESQLNGLTLISLKKFQEVAQDRKFMLEVPLNAPQVDEKAPMPPPPPKVGG